MAFWKYCQRKEGFSERRSFKAENSTLLMMTKRKGGETMDARGLIMEADKIRRDQSLSQAEWGKLAGLDSVGVAVGRTYNRGNCKLTTMVSLLKPLGYELRLVKLEDLP